MKTNKIIILIVLLLLTQKVISQDIHFSKFYDAPLILNPANTGNFDGKWRIINNYRRQGEQLSPYYTTSTIAFDHSINIVGQKAGLGIIYIHDNSSVYSLFSNKLFLSVGYFIKTSEKSYLHAGFQLGYVLKNISNKNLTYPDQFDMSTGYFSSNIATSEEQQFYTANYFDLNWGLIWSYNQGSYKFESGIAMFHSNMPNESFINEKNLLKPKYLTHLYLMKKITTKYYLETMLLYANMNNASETLSGLVVGYKTNNENFKDFNIGLLLRGGFKRTQDALIAKCGFNYKNFNFSISYDIEISNKRGVAYSGKAVELSLNFYRPETKLKVRKIKCEIF